MSTNEDADADNGGTTETSGDAGTDAGPGSREVAYRLFATEFDDSELSYSESDEERAPNYVVTPTGLRLNRLFTVGVLTEVERLNSDTLRGRIVDPTGAFVTYAGQYQPEAQAFLDSADSPSFVAITGKARTFEPDDADRIFTSVRPESLSEVTADTRDRWTVSVAEATVERLAVVAAALDSELRGDELRAALETAGVDAPLAAGIPRALDYYGTTEAYLEAIRQVAVDALEVVTGERDEVRSVEVAPDEGGSVTLGPLPDVGIDLAGDATESTDAGETPVSATSESADSTATPDVEADSTAADTAKPSEPTAEPSEPTTESTESAAEPAEPTTESTEPATEPSEPAPESTESATELSEQTTEPTESATEPAEPTTEPTATETTTETTAEPTTTAASDDSSPSDTTTTATGDDSSPSNAATESTTVESSMTDTDREPTASSEPATTDDGVTDTDDIGDPVDDAADEPEMYQLDDEEREELESEFGADFSSGNEVDPAGEADIDVPDADELAADAADSEPSDGDTVTAESKTADTAESPTTDATPTETSDPAESTDTTETLGSFEDTIDDTAGSAADTKSDRPGVSDDTDGDGSDIAAESDTTAAGSDTTDIGLEDAAVELMGTLDDGDGADREAVVSALVDDHGVESAAVEDAIDDALMSGRCYEPDDGTLKPI